MLYLPTLVGHSLHGVADGNTNCAHETVISRVNLKRIAFDSPSTLKLQVKKIFSYVTLNEKSSVSINFINVTIK